MKNEKKNNFIFAGFWKRTLATIIDAAIAMIFMPITVKIMLWECNNRSAYFHVIISLFWIIFYLWMVVKYGGTPGKLLINLRIVNKYCTYLSWKKAFLRIIFPSLLISLNSALQYWTVVTTYPEGLNPLTFMQLGEYAEKYGQPFYNISLYLGALIYIDIGTILFNKEKRAVHDFIAGCYVITKKSYLENR